MDLMLVLIALAVVLKDSLEVTIIYHGHWSVPIGVSAVPIEFMNRILEPFIALLFKGILINEDVVKNQTYLHKF